MPGAGNVYDPLDHAGRCGLGEFLVPPTGLVPQLLRALRGTCVVCVAAAALNSCAAPKAPVGAMESDKALIPVAQITQITVERDCFGCPTGSRLVLRRDGTALLTVTGKARHRTQDSTAQAALSHADFDAIAQLALAQGFFDWRDEYADANLQDGAWTTWRITRGAQDKQVFSREGAGPQGLRALLAAAEALQARLRFVPD